MTDGGIKEYRLQNDVLDFLPTLTHVTWPMCRDRHVKNHQYFKVNFQSLGTHDKNDLF